MGGLLGAFTAVTTGGNILESVVEGCINGAIGSACGILISNPAAAVLLAATGSAAVDVATQLTVQYVETNSIDVTKVDPVRVAKTGFLTGLGTAIPAFGKGAANAVDAFGTALIWAEGATLLACVDVVVTNMCSSSQQKTTDSAPNPHGRNSRDLQSVYMRG